MKGYSHIYRTPEGITQTKSKRLLEELTNILNEGNNLIITHDYKKKSKSKK